MAYALRTVFTDNGPKQFEFNHTPKDPTYSDILSLTPRSCKTCVWKCQKCAQTNTVCDGWTISEPDYQEGRAAYYSQLQQKERNE